MNDERRSSQISARFRAAFRTRHPSSWSIAEIMIPKLRSALTLCESKAPEQPSPRSAQVESYDSLVKV